MAACLATPGPGAPNLVTGVADATHVAITGQVARDRIGAGRHSPKMR
jgi:thiamine pyrophosphate-dependent acetolactate synthase large subunit-like protein